MRHLRKLIFVTGAILGVILLGVVWLVHSALGVAEDVVDTTAHVVDVTASSVKGAVASAQKEDAKSTASAQKPTSDVMTAVKTSPTSDRPSSAPTNADKSVKPGTAAAKGEDKEENDLAEVGQLFKLFLDGDAADLDTTDAILIPSDDTKDGKGTKDSDDLTALLPGADSPTVRGILQGKYKGKESQIIDDALEDPKAWRLVFFLSGM